MTQKVNKTVKYYDENADEWALAHRANDPSLYWEDKMKRFNELLPRGKILEIGSGSGKDASYLIKFGYKYTGTDASKGLLSIASAKNPNATFKNIPVQQLSDKFSPNTFDGFWTTATLLHVPKDQIDLALKNIHKVVKDGGIGFITIKEGKGEREDETGRLFSYYTRQEFSQILKSNGFEVLEFDRKPVTEKTIWLIYFVRVLK